LKRLREETSQSKKPRKKTMKRKRRRRPKCNKVKPKYKDGISLLSKDLKLELVSFLTRSETLTLARCSSYLAKEFTSDDVWRAFIRRISPSLLCLPMKEVNNCRNKLKVFLQEPVRKINKTLELHLVLKFNGVVHAVTLSNPKMRKDEEEWEEWVTFFSGHDFQSNIPCYKIRGCSIMLLLTYNGMTSVLVPEKKVLENTVTLYGNKLELKFYDHETQGYVMVWARIHFKWVGSEETNTREENVLSNPAYSGIKSVSLCLSNDSDNYFESSCRPEFKPIMSEQLSWY
jgi:hypothetical protein